MEARISDVARLAGVSATTVSHALSGRRPVSASARARVARAVADLGYRANPAASALRTGRSATVALVVPDIANPFYPAFARGVQDVCDEAGSLVIVSSTDGQRMREERIVRDLVQRSVDGMIVALFELPAAEVRAGVPADFPIVWVGGGPGGSGDRVRGDDRADAAVATRHLLAGGRTSLAYLGGPSGAGPSDARRSGYADALRDAGLTAAAVAVSDAYTEAAGFEATTGLLEAGELFDGLVCANDLLAIGAMSAVKRKGLKVPEDVAIVGFDDIDAARLVAPSLSSMANHPSSMGRISAGFLLDRIAGEQGAFRDAVVPGELKIRQSSAGRS